ncbi:MAG: hypothetical protein LBH43_07115 [Treponema sp.]|jgi:hypothetical protein|nr:hypothetical protein [Treponema sp.]
MIGAIKVMHGGSDCSCKNIGIEGETVTVSDLLNMLLKAQELSIDRICIHKYQFNSLINCIRASQGEKV